MITFLYFTGVLLFIYYFYFLSTMDVRAEQVKSIKVTTQNPNVDERVLVSFAKFLLIHLLFSVLFLVWCGLGIFTPFFWYFFILLIVDFGTQIYNKNFKDSLKKYGVFITISTTLFKMVGIAFTLYNL